MRPYFPPENPNAKPPSHCRKCCGERSFKLKRRSIIAKYIFLGLILLQGFILKKGGTDLYYAFVHRYRLYRIIHVLCLHVYLQGFFLHNWERDLIFVCTGICKISLEVQGFLQGHYPGCRVSHKG